MIYDNIPLIGLEGHVRAEVRDALTDKLKQVEEGKNGITTFGANLIEAKQKAGIGLGTGRTTLFVHPSYPEFSEGSVKNANLLEGIDLFKAVVLSDDDTPFSAADASFRGNVTGIANKALYNPGTSLYGVLNTAESYYNSEKIVSVFDFASDRGNGTHKSINFMRHQGAPRAHTFPAYALHPTDRACLVAADSTSGAIARDADYLYHLYRATSLYLRKTDLSGNVISNTLLSESGGTLNPYWPHSVCCGIYNNKMYIADGMAGKFWRIDLATFTATVLTTPTGLANASWKFTIKDNYMYYTHSNQVHRYNLATETYDTYKTAPAGLATKMIFVFDGILFAGASDNTKTYVYDWGANTLTVYFSDCNIFGSSPSNWDIFTSSGWYGGMTSHNNSTYIVKQTTQNYINASNQDAAMYALQLAKIDPAKAKQQVMAKKVFDVPVVKNNTQTMKVTYTLNFV